MSKIKSRHFITVLTIRDNQTVLSADGGVYKFMDRAKPGTDAAHLQMLEWPASVLFKILKIETRRMDGFYEVTNYEITNERVRIEHEVQRVAIVTTLRNAFQKGRNRLVPVDLIQEKYPKAASDENLKWLAREGLIDLCFANKAGDRIASEDYQIAIGAGNYKTATGGVAKFNEDDFYKVIGMGASLAPVCFQAATIVGSDKIADARSEGADIENIQIKIWLQHLAAVYAGQKECHELIKGIIHGICEAKEHRTNKFKPPVLGLREEKGWDSSIYQ